MCLPSHPQVRANALRRLQVLVDDQVKYTRPTAYAASTRFWVDTSFREVGAQVNAIRWTSRAFWCETLTCPAAGVCRTGDGTCEEGVCRYETLDDGTDCTEDGMSGQCNGGRCRLPSDTTSTLSTSSTAPTTTTLAPTTTAASTSSSSQPQTTPAPTTSTTATGSGCGCQALSQCHNVGVCLLNGACTNPTKADGKRKIRRKKKAECYSYFIWME